MLNPGLNEALYTTCLRIGISYANLPARGISRREKAFNKDQFLKYDYPDYIRPYFTERKHNEKARYISRIIKFDFIRYLVYLAASSGTLVWKDSRYINQFIEEDIGNYSQMNFNSWIHEYLEEKMDTEAGSYFNSGRFHYTYEPVRPYDLIRTFTQGIADFHEAEFWTYVPLSFSLAVMLDNLSLEASSEYAGKEYSDFLESVLSDTPLAEQLLFLYTKVGLGLILDGNRLEKRRAECYECYIHMIEQFINQEDRRIQYDSLEVIMQ